MWGTPITMQHRLEGLSSTLAGRLCTQRWSGHQAGITGGDGGGAVQKHAQFLCLVLAIVAVVCDEKFSSNSAKWQEFEQENDG